MSSVMQLIRNGGQVIEDVDLIKEYMKSLASENNMLKSTIEKQTAVLTAVMDELGVVKQELFDIKDIVTVGKELSDEIKHTKFIGQKPKILPTAREIADKMTGNAVRSLIHRAAKKHPSGIRRGYTVIYEKLAEVTGFDVYNIGKITLNKSDGVDGWKKDPSYINAILREGYKTEVAIVCKQILAD